MTDPNGAQVLTDADINDIAEHVTAPTVDPRARHIPNGTVATLIAMLREAQGKLAEVLGNVRATEWGSGCDTSYVKLCGAPNDAYDYARAYDEHVFTRKLYASPWKEDHNDDG